MTEEAGINPLMGKNIVRDGLPETLCLLEQWEWSLPAQPGAEFFNGKSPR